MARDLSFWKVKKVTQEKNKDIYIKLSEGEYLDFVAELPTEQILQDFKHAFSEWENINGQCYVKAESEIQLFITEQFVRADCYSVAEMDLNKIIDILLKYDCPLYDAIIDVRFDEY